LLREWLSATGWRHSPSTSAIATVHRWARRTGTGPDNPQTVVWRSGPTGRKSRFDSLETISRLTYFDMLEHWDVMQVCLEDEAL